MTNQSRLLLLLAACLLAACPATVTTMSSTGPRPPPPDRPDRPDRPTRPAWDSTGWTLLGSQWVDGKVDRDVIRVNPGDAKVTSLTMVVTDSDLELLDFVVVFGNGTKFEPK